MSIQTKKINALPPWLRLLRPHQWTKNLLLFLPALTSSNLLRFDTAATLTLGVLAFSCAASAGYVLNDIVDRDEDRRNPQKASRPLANGDIKPHVAFGIGMVALFCSLTASRIVSDQFFTLTCFYLLLSTTYSLGFKRFFLVDILVLISLYLLRIVAGAEAIETPLTHWLIAFSIAVFGSLSLMKRCAELMNIEKQGKDLILGRGYKTKHLKLLCSSGFILALVAIVIFSTYANDVAVLARYSAPRIVWLVVPLFSIWILSLWRATYRGQMAEDPIVYVLTKTWSLTTIAAMFSLTLAAQNYQP